MLEIMVKYFLEKDKDKDNQHLINTNSKLLQIGGLLQERYQGFQQKGVNDAFDLHRHVIADYSDYTRSFVRIADA